MGAEENKQVVKDLYAAFDRRDIAAVAAHVVKDVTETRATSSISFKNLVVALKSRT
ncbi:MAG TPA: hypothetical protein VFJ56_00555 [Nitrospira sp.]|nr:hypothetical protein [Nitrospira sp.]